MEKSEHYPKLQDARTEFTSICFVVYETYEFEKKSSMDQTRSIIAMAKRMSERGDIYFKIVLMIKTQHE